jgi:hypothetical protein
MPHRCVCRQPRPPRRSPPSLGDSLDNRRATSSDSPTTLTVPPSFSYPHRRPESTPKRAFGIPIRSFGARFALVWATMPLTDGPS